MRNYIVLKESTGELFVDVEPPSKYFAVLGIYKIPNMPSALSEVARFEVIYNAFYLSWDRATSIESPFIV